MSQEDQLLKTPSLNLGDRFRAIVASVLLPAQILTTTLPPAQTAAIVGAGAAIGLAGTATPSKAQFAIPETVAITSSIIAMLAQLPDLNELFTSSSASKQDQIFKNSQKLLTNQAEILSLLKGLNLTIRKELEDGFLNNDVRNILGYYKQFEILLAENNPADNREAFRKLSHEVNIITSKIGTYGPAAITGYVGAASLQYALLKATGSPPAVLRQVASHHKDIIRQWLDPKSSGSLTHQLGIVRAEIGPLQKFLDTPREIGFAEGVQIWAPPSSGKGTVDVYRISLYYAGKGGEKLFEDGATEAGKFYFRPKRTNSFGYFGVPWRYQFSDQGGVYFNNASDADKSQFTCLKGQERYTTEIVPTNKNVPYESLYQTREAAEKEALRYITNESLFSRYAKIDCIPEVYKGKIKELETSRGREASLLSLEKALEKFERQITQIDQTSRQRQEELARPKPPAVPIVDDNQDSSAILRNLLERSSPKGKIYTPEFLPAPEPGRI